MTNIIVSTIKSFPFIIINIFHGFGSIGWHVAMGPVRCKLRHSINHTPTNTIDTVVQSASYRTHNKQHRLQSLQVQWEGFISEVGKMLEKHGHTQTKDRECYVLCCAAPIDLLFEQINSFNSYRGYNKSQKKVDKASLKHRSGRD